jgi:hypothetical protein
MPVHEPTDIVNTDNRRQRDGEDAACLSTADEGQNHRFKAYLTQKAVEENSYVEDYMGMEGREERHGSLKTYVDKNFIERERQTTHHKESIMFNKAYQGDATKMIDEAPKGNKFKLVMRYHTATKRSGCSLDDTVNCARQFENMMNQTLGVDADDLIDDDKGVLDEVSPEEHDEHYRDRLFKDMTEVAIPIQKAMEIAPLDALYPTIRVSSDSKKLQTHNRVSAMHESTYQEDVMNESYREIAPLDAWYPMIREIPRGVCHAREYLPGGREAGDLPGEQELCQEHDDEDSSSPDRSSNPDHKSSPDDHDPYNVGSQNEEGHTKIKLITFAMEGEEGHN